MNFQVQLMSVAVLLLSACASIHPGNVGECDNETNPTIVTSAERASEASDENYDFVTFTIENKGNQIARILETDLSFEGESNKTVNVIVGKDLGTWIEAFKEEEQRRKHNRRVGQLAMIIGGALLGVAGDASDTSALKVIGGTSMLAGGVWGITDSISTSVGETERAKQVPETHIYSSFSVPAEMYVRRWAVLQIPKGTELGKIALKLVFEDRTEKTYVFKL